MMNKIDHIGIAVFSLEEGIALYRDKFGMQLVSIEEVTDQGVKMAMFECGEVHIELLEPLNDESPVAKFLKKNGQGLHHICYEVDDAGDALEALADKGLQLIDNDARVGGSGKMVGFIHPKSALGVLTEINSTVK